MLEGTVVPAHTKQSLIRSVRTKRSAGDMQPDRHLSQIARELNQYVKIEGEYA
jgi:hypothetical protein